MLERAIEAYKVREDSKTIEQTKVKQQIRAIKVKQKLVQEIKDHSNFARRKVSSSQQHNRDIDEELREQRYQYATQLQKLRESKEEVAKLALQ